MRTGALVAILTLAQAGTPPAFDVATVRPSTRESAPLSIQRQPGGRLVASSASLRFLITWAYALDDGRLLGVPDGADTALFDIVAQAADANPIAGQMQLMMRTLLAERFKLVVHRETRELAAYALATDDKGPRVSVAAATAPPDANPFRMSGSGALTGTRVTADMLATVLSNELGRPVRNETGVTGVFTFTLQWRPDTGAATDDARPSLFTAIREQLGFRLVARTVPADVLVIDRLELRPTEN